MFLGVWILFLLAGLLVGGAWSAYQNGSKPLTIIAVALAIITGAAALSWLIAEIPG